MTILVTYCLSIMGHPARPYLPILLTISAVLACLLATPRAAADVEMEAVRLIDRLAEGGDHAEIIEGTKRRVLPPNQGVQTIRLDPAPRLPILRFSIGLLPGEPRAPVRFRAVIRLADGSLKKLYDRKVDAPGWYDEQLELGEFDLAGAVLVLKRNVLGKARGGETPRGVWGEPMLLPSAPTKRDSVVLVSIDTLRADRVGAFGSSAGITPNLDKFAKTSVSYEQAYSPSTWTLPSHFSMLRGIPASAGPQRANEMLDRDPPPLPALASVFRDAGYLTAGFTGGGYVSCRYGFAEGFDSYYSHVHAKPPETGCAPERFDGPEVVRRTRQWLRKNGDRPFFLFVHTYDAHDRCPMQRPAKGKRRWDSTPKGQKRMSEYYSTVITKADRVLGDVLAEIESLPAKRRIIVAVTSDHGEALWEHGTFGHGCPSKPYDPLVRVPLIVRPASKRGGSRVATPVSVGSIAPTLLTLAGLPPAVSMVEPLLPGLGFDDRDQQEPVYTGCGDQLAVRYGRYKLIAIRNKAYRNELYDLANDPAEVEDLALERPRVTGKLHELAKAYWKQAPAAEREPQGKARLLDETTRDRLRALGYLE